MKYKDLPKIELHCHLDGSVRPETVIDIAKKENIKLPSYDINVINKMMIAPNECLSLDEYLKTFDLPLSIMQSKESLKRISFELLEDCAKENVKYIEVRFAPMLHIEKGLSIKDVIDSVLYGIKKAEKFYDIKGNLILSCLKHMSVDSVYEVIDNGKNYLGNGVVAIDLAGSEKEGFSSRFIEPINYAKELGFRITIHAGETGIGRNVLEAVKLLNAERIGHGVAIIDHSEAYKLVKSNKIFLEICPTSNVQTKAVNRIENHPIYDFYKDNILITVNTDNRTVSDTTLSNEFEIIMKNFKLNYEDYKNIYLNSIKASFADEDTKKKLIEYII